MSRSIVVDVLKGVGISLIVIGHAKNISSLNEAISFLFLFHVPLFFMISGLTINADDSLGKLLDRAIAVGMAYFVLSLLAMPKFLFLNRDNDPLSFFQGVLYGTGHTIVVTPIWFLTCLSLSIAIAGIVLAITKGRGQLSFVVLLFLSSGAYFLAHQYYSFNEKVGLGSPEASGYPWNIDLSLLGAGFILLGSIFKSKLSEIGTVKSELIGLFLCLFITVVLYYFYPIKVDLNFRIFQPWYIAILTAISGIALIVFLARLISKINTISNIFVVIGQSSLVILFLHRDIQIVLTKMLSKFLPGHANSLNFYTIFCLFVFPIAISVFCDLFLIRKFRLISKIIYPRLKVFQR